mmetsp:Transcript_8202/g.22054  ORF Transcript_8202/g.22054 Transcript_8202/m.22054 type:complete len:629 (+) Transcript_8202:178-2064(+)
MAVSASEQVDADAAAAQGAARNAVQHLREASGDDYDAFMALPEDARRAAYDELVRAARSTLHAPLRGVNAQKRERLKTMKVLILDNSQREPSVASVWGHTLADKLEIDSIVRGLGFQHVIAGVPTADANTVDDLFCQQLGDTPYTSWTFSEFTDWNLMDGVPVFDDTHVPVGMRKTAEYGLRHVILEVDTCASFWDCNFSLADFTEGVVFWTRWLRERATDGTLIVNLRDLAKGMLRCPDRCVAMVVAMAELPRDVRPAALLFEEPFGEYLPCEVGGWTALLRATMDAHGWPSKFQENGESIDGALLIHVHRQWGLADAVTLDALAGGCDGIMAAVCEEGAALGHASSAVALANLARLGNRDVVTRYNLRGVIEGARQVTKLTTGAPVAVRQPVYGPRAIEAVFGFTAVGGGVVDHTFDRDGSGTAADDVFLGDILGVAEKPVRLHTLATPTQFAERLAQCFGADESFDDVLGAKLKDGLLALLASGDKAECTSPVGLALLHQRVTGTLTEAMVACVKGANEGGHDVLLTQAEVCFKEAQGDGEGLTYSKFAERFVDPYLGARHNTFGVDLGDKVREAVRKSFDLDGDRDIDWDEYRVWLVWALRSRTPSTASTTCSRPSSGGGLCPG